MRLRIRLLVEWSFRPPIPAGAGTPTPNALPALTAVDNAAFPAAAFWTFHDDFISIAHSLIVSTCTRNASSVCVMRPIRPIP